MRHGYRRVHGVLRHRGWITNIKPTPLRDWPKRHRFRYISPVAQPARHRAKRLKIRASGDPGIGAAQLQHQAALSGARHEWAQGQPLL
jgi:hypothetical protein